MKNSMIITWFQSGVFRWIGITGMVVAGMLSASLDVSLAEHYPDCTIEGAQANSQFGWSVRTAGDVNGDGYADVIVGVPHFCHENFQEGQVLVYHGSATGLHRAWTAEGGQDHAMFGFSSGTAGDVNGDGYGDVIITAPHVSEVVVYYGSATGLDATRVWKFKLHLGLLRSVGTAGDVNGDGFADVIIGDSAFNRVFVYYGSANGLDSTRGWMTQGYDLFGYAVGNAGDVNGDGFDDVIVGNPNSGGQVSVYYGATTGLNASRVRSIKGWRGFGDSVSTAGDVNGDGFDDVIVGVPDSGEVFVYYGAEEGLRSSRFWTRQEVDWFTCSIGLAGDINTDGFDDVIVGAQHAHEVLVYYGSVDGLDASRLWAMMGDGKFGCSVSIVDDVNGDGYADIVIGAPGHDNEIGKVVVYYGRENDSMKHVAAHKTH